uniref:Uncharacterized protein n=1 Tax=Panagrolaimus davidi TaxID=227884 RepID=A0A914PUB6_9BILA
MNFKVFLLIFIGFLNSFQHVSAASCSSSDISNINKCYYDYLTALRIDPSSTFEYYYQYVRNNYLLVSWNGVNQLCNTFGKLQFCVNKDCMNLGDFKKVATYGGISANDFIGNYYAFEYMCSSEGNLRYKNSYECLKSNSEIIGKNCGSFGNDCFSRNIENKCIVNYAKEYCGSEAYIYTNNSLSTILCHSRPECCY